MEGSYSSMNNFNGILAIPPFKLNIDNIWTPNKTVDVTTYPCPNLSIFFS